MELIDNEKFELETFDNVLIRKLIECVKVLSKTEILVIFTFLKTQFFFRTGAKPCAR